MKYQSKYSLIAVLFILPMFLIACGGGEESEAPSADVGAPPTEEIIVEEEAPTEIVVEATEADTPEPALPALPAAPQDIEIITEDGRTLEALYYPAAVNPAPIVVLMHWAGGDMEDWEAIAPWLQNRDNESSRIIDGQMSNISFTSLSVQGPWLDPSWFPFMPDGISFGVLTFNFGGFGGSEPGDLPESWADDAYSAVMNASQLEGVDAAQISAIGGSIGADGAVDGCYVFNLSGASGQCLGALALSPGNYLTENFTFSEAVTSLDKNQAAVWCLTSEDDQLSYDTCDSSIGSRYFQITYGGDGHAMNLIVPDLHPIDPALEVDTMVTIQDFLEEVYGKEIN